MVFARRLLGKRGLSGLAMKFSLLDTYFLISTCADGWKMYGGFIMSFCISMSLISSRRMDYLKKSTYFLSHPSPFNLEIPPLTS